MASAALSFVISQTLTKVGDAVRAWIQNREQQQEHVGSRFIRNLTVVMVALEGILVWFIMFSWLISGLLSVVGVYARLYTAVETFVSLRAPPIGTYDTVSWTGFMPHIE